MDLVRASAPAHPQLGADPNLLADVACIALNNLKPRYFRHSVDLHFFMGAEERARNAAAAQRAVDQAFAYVARRRMKSSREGPTRA